MRRRILVIEKDPFICHALKNCTQDRTTDIDCADSLLEILSSFLEQDYCLVIIGISPTEKSGIELLRQVQVIKVPVLALTPPLNSEDKTFLFRSGICAYIEKPVDIEVCKVQADALIQICMKPNREISRHSPLVFGTELIIEPQYHQVIVNGQPLKLTKKSLIYCIISQDIPVRYSAGSIYMIVSGRKTLPFMV